MTSTVKTSAKSLVDEPLYTIDEAAQKLGVGRDVIYRAVTHHRIGHCYLGRKIMIPTADLNAFLAATYTPGELK